MDIATLEAHRRHATVPSGPVSFLDVGQGRAAVFIHGVITNSLLWRHVIGAVASEHRRCIALDLPGHGHTPAAIGDADVSLTGLAQRVIDLCDHLNLEQVDLVANDTGGAVAQIAAADLGDRLATLTLTNCDTEPNMRAANVQTRCCSGTLAPHLRGTWAVDGRPPHCHAVGVRGGLPERPSHPTRCPRRVLASGPRHAGRSRGFRVSVGIPEFS
jgi:pimeloyl-ACP methyl ester carboxylesterase